MTEVRRFGMVDFLLLLIILAGAGGARAYYLNVCAQNGAQDGAYLVQDDSSQERDALVSNLAAGRGFSSPAPFAAGEEPTAHMAPLYPWLLSLLERAAPDHNTAYQWARWIQCALGALTAGLYFLFARRAFNSLIAGTLAGVLCAVHPFWIVNNAQLADGTLATFLLGLSLWLGARAGHGGAAMTSLLFGIALAGLTQVRAAYFPFAFAAMLCFLLRCRWLQRGWLYAILAFLGFLNGFLPWTLRNTQTFSTFVPVVDSTYYHLWTGNNPRATGGPLPDTTLLQALAEKRGTDEKVVAGQLSGMNQPARYRSLARDVFDEIQTRPADTLQRRLRAGLAFFFGENWLIGQPLWKQARAEQIPESVSQWLPTCLVGSLFGMLLLGVLGWRWTYAWRYESMYASLAAIWIPLPYILGHAETLHGPRLPLDGVLLCYAAFVLSCLVPNLTGSLLRGPGDDTAS